MTKQEDMDDEKQLEVKIKKEWRGYRKGMKDWSQGGEDGEKVLGSYKNIESPVTEGNQAANGNRTQLTRGSLQESR